MNERGFTALDGKGEEKYEITTAQIVQEALIFYFECFGDRDLREEAKKTHRTSRQMLIYLLELGWQKYREDNSASQR